MVNTSAPLYAVMKAGFDKHWMQDYKAGLVSVNTSMPDYFSVLGFNAFLAAAHAMNALFLEWHPPVYANSPVGIRPEPFLLSLFSSVNSRSSPSLRHRKPTYAE